MAWARPLSFVCCSWVKDILEEIEDRFSDEALGIFAAFSIFDFGSGLWDAFANGGDPAFGVAEIGVLAAWYGTSKKCYIENSEIEVGDEVVATMINDSNKQTWRGKVEKKFETEGKPQLEVFWFKDKQRMAIGLDYEGLCCVKRASGGNGQVVVPPLLDCSKLKEEWLAFRECMLKKIGSSERPYFEKMSRKKDLILQGVMRDQEACEKFPNVLALFQMSSVFALGAMDCERIFSAHNLIKTPMRTGMDVKASAAQTRLLMLKHEMQFGSEKFEAFVAKVSVATD